MTVYGRNISWEISCIVDGNILYEISLTFSTRNQDYIHQLLIKRASKIENGTLLILYSTFRSTDSSRSTKIIVIIMKLGSWGLLKLSACSPLCLSPEHELTHPKSLPTKASSFVDLHEVPSNLPQCCGINCARREEHKGKKILPHCSLEYVLLQKKIIFITWQCLQWLQQNLFRIFIALRFVSDNKIHNFHFILVTFGS
jgi:hypothetical protein